MSTYERRYSDEDAWETIDEETARRVLARFYIDVDRVLDAMRAGQTIRTTTAKYRIAREEGTP